MFLPLAYVLSQGSNSCLKLARDEAYRSWPGATPARLLKIWATDRPAGPEGAPKGRPLRNQGTPPGAQRSGDRGVGHGVVRRAARVRRLAWHARGRGASFRPAGA